MQSRIQKSFFAALSILFLAAFCSGQGKQEDVRKEADRLCDLGYHYDYQLGMADTAKILYEQSLKLYEELGDKRKISYVLNLLGIIYKDKADFTKALELFEKGIALAKETKDLKIECSLTNNLSSVMSLLGKREEVHRIRERTLELARKVGDSLLIADCLLMSAQSSFGQLDFKSALASACEASDIFTALNRRDKVCRAAIMESFILNFSGDSTLAENRAREALVIAQELGNDELEMKALTCLSASISSSKLDEIIEVQERGYTLAIKLGMHGMAKILCNELGYCYYLTGKDSLSIVYYQRSIETADKIRQKLGTESQKSGWTESTRLAYNGMITVQQETGNISDAFYYSERARARSFLDLLASAQVKVGKPQHREFLAKENEIADQKGEIEQQIAAAGEDTAQVVARRGKLEGDWGEVLTSLEEQKRQEPELASLVSVNPLTLPEVQKLLDKATTLLEYFLTEKKTLLWLVTRKNAEVFQVDLGGDSLKALVMEFRKAIQEQSETGELSSQLYDLLIAPTADKIKTENLIIVPHGILHYLPFAALRDSEGRYLLEDYRLRYLPSASVLKFLPSKRRGRGETLLALGNPATDRKGFASIPLTETEVAEIAVINRQSRLLTGGQATETEFKRLAPQSDILHLACHGDLNSAYPMYSCLLLTPDSLEDGELDVHEIFNLDLNANLVVLSGCQTGLGHLTNGDELVGLSRAFIYAGTPSIVSSLWMVEDESTAYLMGRVYHHLQSHDKAQALRQAQLETRQKYPGLRSWASFVLTGEAM